MVRVELKTAGSELRTCGTVDAAIIDVEGTFHVIF
jgi:hypothetical protein